MSGTINVKLNQKDIARHLFMNEQTLLVVCDTVNLNNLPLKKNPSSCLTHLRHRRAAAEHLHSDVYRLCRHNILTEQPRTDSKNNIENVYVLYIWCLCTTATLSLERSGYLNLTGCQTDGYSLLLLTMIGYSDQQMELFDFKPIKSE